MKCCIYGGECFITFSALGKKKAKLEENLNENKLANVNENLGTYKTYAPYLCLVLLHGVDRSFVLLSC